MAVLMRAALGLVLGVLAACEPEIGSGTYYCGPEEDCPPDLGCDGVTATCVFPDEVEAFACGAGGSATEPDDELDAPFDVGVAGCGVAVAQPGCIADAGDVDHLALATPAGCDQPLQAELQFQVAFAPLEVELIDDGGAVVATGAICDELDGIGRVHVCLEAEVDAEAAYVLRVRRGDGGDCGGDCAFNRYDLSIF